MATSSRVFGGLEETIVAISSPRGSGKRGIVRLSGGQSISIVAAALEPGRSNIDRSVQGWQVVDGRFIVGRAGVSAPVTVYVMPGPKSFTGEDQVELHLPGSPTLLEMVVEVTRRSGARLALPGEFTQRAFLNGRIDLTRAEAVAATIHARSEGERIAALGILAGDRAAEIRALGDRVASLLAGVELDIDFSDQDIDIVQPDGLAASITALAEELEEAAEKPGADRHRLVRRRVLLCGPANAGKSSLFNALAGRDQAIVTSRSGTTRDFLETQIEIDGTMIVLVDTAGDDFHGDAIDEAAHRIREREKKVSNHVLQVRCGTTYEPAENDSSTGVLLLSHADLVAPRSRPDLGEQVIWYSVRSGEGVEDIRRLLNAIVAQDEEGSDQALAHLDQRHREGFAGAADSMRRCGQTLKMELGMELVAADLHDALGRLRELTGEEYSEEILDRIMRDFCIGK